MVFIVCFRIWFGLVLVIVEDFWGSSGSRGICKGLGFSISRVEVIYRKGWKESGGRGRGREKRGEARVGK